MARPSLVDFDTLVRVEQAFQSGYMKYALYDRWMNINGLGYNTHSDPIYRKQVWSAITEQCTKRCDCKRPELKYSLRGQCGTIKTDERRGYQYVFIWTNSRRRQLRWLNRVFPYASEADRQATQLDVASFVAEALSKGTREERTKRTRTLNRLFSYLPLGVSNSLVLALCINALGSDIFRELYFPVLQRLAGSCTKCLATVFKEISVAVRRTSHFFSRRLSDHATARLTALEMCTGRAFSEVDWLAEYRNRCVRETPISLPFYSDGRAEFTKRLQSSLWEAFSSIIDHTSTGKSYEEEMRDRQQWLASGSAGPQYVTIPGPNPTKVRLNKRSYSDTLTHGQVSAWPAERPTITATGSIKAESGKSRAIYATDMRSYMLTSFVISGLERKLNLLDGIEIGLSGLPEMIAVRSRVDETVSGSDCTMLDYADFNAQHTPAYQAAVFQTIADISRVQAGKSDFTNIAQWVADAHLNQQVRFPGRPGFHAVRQGMFSGNRATSFLNTILNRSYFDVLRDWVTEHFHVAPTQLKRIHMGDDVWCTTKGRLFALIHYAGLRASGFEMQASKQMFGQDRGEFLRVLYSGGVARGYLNRAIASLIIHPLDSGSKINPLAKARSLQDHIDVLIRRGLSLWCAQTIWWATVPHASNFSIPLPGGNKLHCSSPAALKRYPTHLGGYGLYPPGRSSDSSGLHPLPGPPQAKVRARDISDNTASHMAGEWVQQLANRVRIPPNDRALFTRTLHEQNATTSATPRSIIVAQMHFARELEVWEACHSPDLLPMPHLTPFPKDITEYGPAYVHAAFVAKEAGDPSQFADLVNTVAMLTAPAEQLKPIERLRFPHAELNRMIAGSHYKSLDNAKAYHGCGVFAAAMYVARNGYTHLPGNDSAPSLIHNLAHKLEPDLLTTVLGGSSVAEEDMMRVIHPSPVSVLTLAAAENTNRKMLYSIPKPSLKCWIDQYQRFVRSTLLSCNLGAFVRYQLY